MIGKFIGFNAALLIVGAAVPAQAVSQTTPAKSATAPVRKAPPTRAQIADLARNNFKIMDANKDGFLSVEEITAQNKKMVSGMISARDKRMNEMFDRLDQNKDGQISRAEFQASGRKIDAAVTKMDTNRDGKVSVDEFVADITSNFDRRDTNRNGQLDANELRAKPTK
jgi:Ca2+-binding EF-hand superfamily protein